MDNKSATADNSAAPSPEELVILLRRDVRMLAISQFVSLFQKHQNIDFSIQVSQQPITAYLNTALRPTVALFGVYADPSLW